MRPNVEIRVSGSFKREGTPKLWDRIHFYRSVGRTSRHWAKESQLLPAPPCTGFSFGVDIGEPVLPEHRAYHRRGTSFERIAPEQSQHARASLEQSLLGEHNPRRVLPRRQRGEPQVPVEPRLIR